MHACRHAHRNKQCYFPTNISNISVYNFHNQTDALVANMQKLSTSFGAKKNKVNILPGLQCQVSCNAVQQMELTYLCRDNISKLLVVHPTTHINVGVYSYIYIYIYYKSSKSCKHCQEAIIKYSFSSTVCKITTCT